MNFDFLVGLEESKASSKIEELGLYPYISSRNNYATHEAFAGYPVSRDKVVVLTIEKNLVKSAYHLESF